MATFTAEDRKKLAASGAAMSDGSYPIRNSTDLENAYKDYIRTGRSDKVAGHIASRAKALGLSNPIAPPKSESEAAARFMAGRRK